MELVSFLLFQMQLLEHSGIIDVPHTLFPLMPLCPPGLAMPKTRFKTGILLVFVHYLERVSYKPSIRVLSRKLCVFRDRNISHQISFIIQRWKTTLKLRQPMNRTPDVSDPGRSHQTWPMVSNFKKNTKYLSRRWWFPNNTGTFYFLLI